MAHLQLVEARHIEAFLKSGRFKGYYDCEKRCSYNAASFPSIAEFRGVTRREFDRSDLQLQAIVLLCDGDVVLAKCVLLVDPWNTCTVESVCVHPEQRGRGLCKAMLGSLIALLRRRRSKQPRFRSVRIYCHSNNARACGCYRSVFGPPVHDAEGSVAFEVRFEDPVFIRSHARGTTR
jgi:ribosomal protein S18 acetylase RimI-like enzyme